MEMTRLFVNIPPPSKSWGLSGQKAGYESTSYRTVVKMKTSFISTTRIRCNPIRTFK